MSFSLNKGGLGASSSNESPAAVREVVARLRGLLASVDSLVEASSLSPKESRELAGTLQVLRSCCTESSKIILSDALVNLAKGLVDHPRLGLLGERLLVLVEGSELPGAALAARCLKLAKDEGGSLGDYAQQTLRRMARPESYASMAVALAGASLAGKAIRLAAGAYLRGGSLASVGGSLAVQGASSMIAVAGEAAVFPFTHNVGMALTGQRMSFANYGSEALHGLKLMGTLNVVGFVSRNAHRALHGVKSLSGAATRARTWAPYTKTVLHGGGELAALTGLSYAEHGGDTLYHLFESAGLMFHLRGARSLGHTLLPGLHHLHRQLDLQNYLSLRNLGLRGVSQIKNAVAKLAARLPQNHALGLAGDVAGPLSPSLQARALAQSSNAYRTGQGGTATSAPKEPTFDQIDLKMARDYYTKGIDPFPNHDRATRDRFLEVALLLTNPIGSPGTHETTAARIDWMWVLKEKFPNQPNEVLIKKVDVSDKLHEVETMRARVIQLMEDGNVNPVTTQSFRDAAQATLDKGEMNLHEFCKLADDYLDVVASDRPFTENIILPHQIDAFPFVIAMPTFGKIDHSNYVDKISNRWLLGEHVMGLNGRGEYFDGNLAKDEKDFIHHDFRHSRRRTRAIKAMDMSREEHTSLLWKRHRVRVASARQGTTLQELGEAFWFTLDHEEMNLPLGSVQAIQDWKQSISHFDTAAFHWASTAWSLENPSWRAYFDSMASQNRQLIIPMYLFTRRVLAPHDLRTLFPPGRNIEGFTNQQMIDALSVLETAIQSPQNS